MTESCTAYDRALRFLYGMLPMFQRVGPAAYKKDLGNIVLLCDALGNPHRKLRAIHVGGTNGKGSAAHMLAAILQCAGYKTGLYTSPHLKEFTERIKVNGVSLPRRFVVHFVEKMKPKIAQIQPSFFELTVAMAFDYFVHAAVDVSVIEVGLGGRLDSTNIIDPLASLITRIGRDHTDLLGNTLPRIAKEKAGIIKPGRKTIIAEKQDEIKHVFLQKGESVGSVVEFAQDKYGIKPQSGAHPHALEVCRGGKPVYHFVPALTGVCQRQNITGVLGVLDELTRQGFDIPSAAVERGIANVTSLTGLKGRWQQLGKSPAVYCDIAHNEDGIREVLKEIQHLRYDNLHIVLGMARDKQVASLLSLLPLRAHYYFCQAGIPRALPAAELYEKAKTYGLQGVVIPSVNAAIRRAKALATWEDLIFIGGSTFVVAEIQEL